MSASAPLVDAELRAAFDLLYGNSPNATAVARGARIAYANPAWERLYGFTDEASYLERPFLEMFATGSRPMLMDLLRRSSAGEEVPPVCRARALRGDGTEFLNELRGTVFLHRGEPCVTVLQAEVVEQQGDATRDVGNDFYKAVFDTNTAIKLLIEPTSGVIVDANAAAVEFYGWPKATLQGMRITDINQLSPPEVQAEMQNAHTGRRRYFRFRHKVASGAVRHVEVYSGPVALDGRQLLLSIIHDVTERDALAAQLRASQHLEAVGRLAGGIAHEFNNLLTVVLNGSSMVLRKMPGDSPLRRYLEDMCFASERAADLTRDLLAFSRRQVMESQSLDLNAVVDRMAGLLQRSLGSSFTIATDNADDLPHTQSDPRQLEHVLMNLVLNARDAMPRGGRIVITTSVTTIEPGDTTVVPAGDWVSMKVADEGEGMDAETQTRLFEPFFTTKGEGRGTGLGLATVYGIVTQSGGHIQVVSARGEGTTIEVLLPISSERESIEPAYRESAPPTPTATILLVDDNEAVRRTLATTLEGFGFHVLEADSANSAIEQWADHAGMIQALVTDIVMPGASGVELVKKLLGVRAGLPVVVISGDLRGHDLSSLPPSVRRLQKPVTGHVLAETLAALLV